MTTKMLIEFDEDDPDWINWAILEDGEDCDTGDILESGSDPLEDFIEMLFEMRKNLK